MFPVGSHQDFLGPPSGDSHEGGPQRKQAGAPGLRAKRRGRLLTRQQKTLANIPDHCPDQLKLPLYLWTRAAVAVLSFKQLGLRVSVGTAGRRRARWGVHGTEARVASLRAGFPGPHRGGLATGLGPSTDDRFNDQRSKISIGPHYFAARL